MVNAFLFAVAFNGLASLASDLTAQCLEIGIKRKKYKKKSVAGASSSADLKFQQQIELNEETQGAWWNDLSWRRAMRFTATGIIFTGVVTWARLGLINHLVSREPGIGNAVWKTFMNEGLFAPFIRALSMGTLQYLDTASWRDVKDKIRQDFVEAQVVAWLWKFPTTFLVFTVFPADPNLQLVSIRFFSYLYNSYFSYVVHRDFVRTPEDENNDNSRISLIKDEEDVSNASDFANLVEKSPVTTPTVAAAL